MKSKAKKGEKKKRVKQRHKDSFASTIATKQKPEMKKKIERGLLVGYLISFRNLLKFSFGFSFVGRVLIGMPFHGEFSIGLLQIIVGSILIDLQNSIVVHTHLFTLVSCSPK